MLLLNPYGTAIATKQFISVNMKQTMLNRGIEVPSMVLYSFELQSNADL